MSAPVVAHPVWCSPAHCDDLAGHADIRHSARPVVLHPAEDDTVVTCAVQRADQRHDDSTDTVAGVELALVNRYLSATPGGPALRADVFLTAADAVLLGRRLLAMAALIGATS